MLDLPLRHPFRLMIPYLWPLDDAMANTAFNRRCKLGPGRSAELDGQQPHAEPTAAELAERGLDAGVEDGGAPALQHEAPGELDRDEAAVAVHDVGENPGAGVGVVDGVELVTVRDAGAARVLAGVEGSDGLVMCEGGPCGCTLRLPFSLP